MVVRQSLPEPLQRPVGGPMSGHVAVENSPRPDFHDHENVQSAEADRDHGEEVARRDRLGVIADERQPPLLRIWRSPWDGLPQVFPQSPR